MAIAPSSRWMPLSATRDDLDLDFPLYCDHPGQLPTAARHPACSRARKVQSSPDQQRHFLRQSPHRRCWPMATPAHRVRACGLCMYGCPYRLIYSTEQNREAMKADRIFTMLPRSSFAPSKRLLTASRFTRAVEVLRLSGSTSRPESTAPPPSCCVPCIAQSAGPPLRLAVFSCSPRCAAVAPQRHRGASAYSGPAFPRDRRQPPSAPHHPPAGLHL